MRISRSFRPDAEAVVYEGDNRQLLSSLPERSIQLIVTSPPYNVGKEYEDRTTLDDYLAAQAEVIDLCVPLLTEGGSICWQVGNHLPRPGAVLPLDIALYPLFAKHDLVLRNRIVWHFGHGLHAKRRFSGRYETVLWFTRDTDDYYFDLDAVRVPQKYPGKRHYKGPKTGEYSGNPGGKNPGDFWDSRLGIDPGDTWDIPNVKANHVEKTEHPCQFPVALAQRLVRALTTEDAWVLDPYLGSGSTACAAILEYRRPIGAEIDPGYRRIAQRRMRMADAGELRVRPMDKPVYSPPPGSPITMRADEISR